MEIYRRDGPDALAVYCCAKATNEDNYLLQKMFRALFRTNNIDHCTRLCHAGSVVALQQAVGSSAMSNTAAEVIHNDVFIVTGSNTTENHPIIALQMKAAVEKHGAKMIVIDPRRIELCDYRRRCGCRSSRAPTCRSSPPWRTSSSKKGWSTEQFIDAAHRGLRRVRPLGREVHPRICRDRLAASTAS